MGDFPLHTAAEFGNFDKVRRLLKKVKNVNGEDGNGYSPLQRAIQSGKTAIVKLLIEKGADVDYSAHHLLHPINLAASLGHLEIIKLLVEKGVPINRSSLEGNLPLHLAAQEGHVDIVEYILDKCNNVDILNSSYCTSLHLATVKGRKEVVKYLLSKNASQRSDLSNCSPIHYAACQGYIEIAEMLLENGACLNEKCPRGWSPLHFACEFGHLDMVKFLISKGAVYEFTSKTENLNIFHLATKSNNLELVQYLVKIGGDVNFSTLKGDTPLHIAVYCGNLKMVQFLVEKGAQINCKLHYSGLSPLYFAVHRCFPDIVDFLIQKGAAFTVKHNGECKLLNKIPNTFTDADTKRRYQHTAEILIKYISLYNKSTPPVLPEVCFKQELISYWQKCKGELEKMDKRFFKNTTVSLYTFMLNIQDEHRLSFYLCNKDIVKELGKVENYLNKLSIYGNLSDFVETGLKKGIRRWDKMNGCDSIMEQIKPRLPAESRFKILNYLSIDDLNNFIKSTENLV